MEAVSAFEALAKSLVGQPISHIWRGDGPTIFLEIGKLTSSTRRRRDGSLGNPRGQLTLGVESNWRVEDDHSILCGSRSEEELWPATFQRLQRDRIQACRLLGALPEVELVSEAGLRLLSFSTTTGQPEWYAIDRRGEKTRSFGVENGELQLRFE